MSGLFFMYGVATCLAVTAFIGAAVLVGCQWVEYKIRFEIKRDKERTARGE